jgi:hypothetical protein
MDELGICVGICVGTDTGAGANCPTFQLYSITGVIGIVLPLLSDKENGHE